MKFKLTNNWRAENQADGIYIKKTIDIPDNEITCLIGCNGIGKTTTLEQIKQELEKTGIIDIRDSKHFNPFSGLFSEESEPTGYIVYFDKDTTLTPVKSNHSWTDDIDLTKIFGMQISNGESIVMRLNKAIDAIKIAINENKPLYILLDDIDAGTSVDVISEIKKLIIDMNNFLKNKNIEHFIVVTSNSFELIRDMNCVYPRTMKQMKFNDYEQYKKFVLKTRKTKEARDKLVN